MTEEKIDLPHAAAGFADAHAHLCMLEDPVGALVRCAHAGVDTVITIVYPSDPEEAASIEEMPAWLERAAAALGHPPGTAEAHGDYAAGPGTLPLVGLAVGCHPHEASTWGPQSEGALRALAGAARVCAIGETGLDYHYDNSPRQDQRTAFAEHLALAEELGLPAIIHLREAHDEGRRILEEVGVPSAGAVLHCFGEDPATAEEFLALGCHISFSGTVTFKKADNIRESARVVPAERLLVETDCPFLAPEPYRGRKNEPAYVTLVARAVATARGEDLEEIAAVTRANTQRLFGLGRTSGAERCEDDG
ncbi:MAG: TatD family hydrolase [Coriobacteriia bacterium]